MNKATAIRVIELDEAIYQLNLILKQDFNVNGATFQYITSQINQLETEKRNLHE